MRANAEDFRRALEPHLVRLFRIGCRLCRNAADAEDLLQDVCLRAFEHRDALICAAEPRAWLLRIQYNLFVDRLRREDRNRAESIDAGVAQENLRAEIDTEADAAAALLADRLSAVWTALTPDQQALLAYYAEGHSLKEIGAITDLPESALKARLHRARTRLGKLLHIQHGQARKIAAPGERR